MGELHLPLTTGIDTGDGRLGLRLGDRPRLGGKYSFTLVLPQEMSELPDLEAVRQARDSMMPERIPDSQDVLLTVTLPMDTTRSRFAINGFRRFMALHALTEGYDAPRDRSFHPWYWPEQGQVTDEGFSYDVVVPDTTTLLWDRIANRHFSTSQTDLVKAGAALIVAHEAISGRPR